MGIFGALNAAVSGLRAQSTALENISGNIANSQTTAYKRVDTAFADLVSSATSAIRAQKAGTVLASARFTNTVQGAIEARSNATYLAINGDGYFAVQEKTSELDGKAVFGGNDMFTRRGDFTIDREGYLVNGAGYYLKGFPVDATTGNITGSLSEVIQIENDFLPAEKTTEITYRANLPSAPLTSSGNTTLDADAVGTAMIGNDIAADDETDFLARSVTGGAVTIYDDNGTPVSVQIRWAKTTESPNDTWNMYYLSDSDATGASTKWTAVNDSGTVTDFVFDSSGTLTSPASSTTTMSTLTVDGTAMGDLELNIGTGGVTQFDDSNGVVQVTSISQDGSAPGEVVDIAITDAGRVVANYTNGKTVDLAEIPLYYFNADSQLKRNDGGAFEPTQGSGIPIVGATGSIISSALEGSNTDIADEFSKLIVTQQAYSANTRIISTSDEMLQEALNMIR